jgi:hypothetical protein
VGQKHRIGKYSADTVKREIATAMWLEMLPENDNSTLPGQDKLTQGLHQSAIDDRKHRD